MNEKGIQMRACFFLFILFFTALTPSTAAGLDELLTRASAVVEGAVVSGQISGNTRTLQITVGSVLLGSLVSGNTVTVECNGLEHVLQGPYPMPHIPKIYFLKSTAIGGWECVPVMMLGYTALGFLGYPQAPPCADGDLQFLRPRSVRERILTRVAESALCGAPQLWPAVIDASSPARSLFGGPGPSPSSGDDFDRRVFRELIKSPRRNLHIEGIRALIMLGDPSPFGLLVSNHREYQANQQEWVAILNTIELTLNDPSVIPHLGTLVAIKDAGLQLATATALQRFHTPAAVLHLGKMIEDQQFEKPLALVAAKGLADFANGCPMSTQAALRTPADYFPHCDEKAPFRTDETVRNVAPRLEVVGDDDRHISFWKNWWLSNRSRVASSPAQ